LFIDFCQIFENNANVLLQKFSTTKRGRTF
jgi:hypothetical protein